MLLLASMSSDWSNELVLVEAMGKCNSINDMAVINGRQLSQLMAACYHGNPEYVQELLAVPGVKVDLQSEEGRHALTCACGNGHTDVACLLLKACPNPQEVVSLPMANGWTSLMLASQHPYTETVLLLLQNGAHVNLQENGGQSSLMIASQHGRTEIVSLLLQYGADISIRNNNGMSPLMLASGYGHTETASVLLQNGAHIDSRGINGWSSLVLASGKGHTETVLLLLQNGANVNMQGDDEFSSLTLASSLGRTETVSLLLENGANVNIQMKDGSFSLMMASTVGHTETVSALLRGGADVNMQRNDGWSSLMIACFKGHTGTVKLLLHNGAEANMKDNDGVSSLMLASQNSHTEAISVLLENGALVNLREKGGGSSLMFASQDGHSKAVSLLIRNGADVNMHDIDGWSSLILASRNGYTDTVSLLLLNGAEVNMQEYMHGRSSLMIASVEGHTETVSVLLQNGANANVHLHNGSSPLMLASTLGNTETVLQLLQNGADANAQDSDGGVSSLMLASHSGHTEMVSLLLQNGANANLQANNGLSALMTASLNGRTETASVLLQNGAHVNMCDSKGHSSLMLASVGHAATVSLLLQGGADANVLSNKGWSSLMTAIQVRHVKIAFDLIESDADVSTVSAEGNSALTLAAGQDLPSVVQKIIGRTTSASVDILDHRNASGSSSLLIASSHGHVEMVDMLLRAGASVNLSNFSDYSSLHLPPQEIELSTYDGKADIADILGNNADVISLLSQYAALSSTKLGGVDSDRSRGTEALKKIAGIQVNADILSKLSKYETALRTGEEKLPDSIKGTALDIAVIQGNTEMVSLLLQYGNTIHNIYYLFRSVILKQVRESRTSASSDFFRISLNQGVSTSLQNVTGTSSWEKYYIIFQLLFSHDNDLINRVQSTKPSILYIACAFAVLEMIKLLFELGTDISDLYRTDDIGLSYFSSLITIISSGSLLSATSSKQISKDVVDLLSQVNWLEYKNILSTLLQNGLDINHKDSSGSFALGIASKEGHTKLVEFLLKSRRANINQQDKDGVSSLMEACAGGYVAITHLLLQYRAKVDLQDRKGWSALMFAVAGGYIDLVVHLLGKGAQPNLRDSLGTSPLMLSCFTGHAGITRVLLAHGADTDLQNNEGITALMMSSYNGHAEIAELLVLKYRVATTVTTNIGLTALDFSKTEAISALLKDFGGKPTILGKRTASMRDPTSLSTRVIVLHGVRELQEEIEDRLQHILRAFSPRPIDLDTSNLMYFEPQDTPKLRDANKLFCDFAYNWEAIAALLKIDGFLINEIRYDCDGEAKICFREMLSKWLKRAIPSPTWGELREAVETATHGIVHITHKIKKN